MWSDALRKNRGASIAVRLALLVAVPFVLGCFVFPHEYYADGAAIGDASQGMQAYLFSADSHNLLMEKSMGSVFPLYKYFDYAPLVSRDMVEFCVGNGSALALPGGARLAPEQEWSLGESEGQKNRGGMATCADVPASSQAWLHPQGGAGGSSIAPEGSMVLNSASKVYPRYEVEYGVLQGLVMVPVFYLLIYYPATEIWRKLRHGMHA